MEITIRTVFYNRNVKVKHVPVYSCNSCENHELMEQTTSIMKSTLAEIARSKSKKTKEVFSFEKRSELAQLLLMAYYQQEESFIENDSILHDVQNLLENLMVDEEMKESFYQEEVRKIINKHVH